MIISKKFKFEAGHRLLHHEGLCHNPHGHNYVIEVFIEGKVNSDTIGMVIDFKTLKDIVYERIIDDFDHAMILNAQDDIMINFCSKYHFKHCIINTEPTAEEMAILFYDKLANIDKYRKVVRVIVWETETSKAIYEG